MLSTIQVRTFREQGYLVFDPELPEAILDAAVSEMLPYWGERQPEGVPFANTGRIQDAWKISDAVWRIAVHRVVLDVLRQLYDAEPRPFQTLNFPVGTQQKTHADTIHFNSRPFGMMCGVWVALEDVGPAQGPLVYYPGSHRLPEMNFEEFSLAPSYAEYRTYEHKIQKLINARSLEPAYGVLQKGQALIWAANLLHGGSPQSDRSLTRHSQVSHYYFAGGRYWRPGLREKRGGWFEPDWVPTSRAGLHLSRLQGHWRQSRKRWRKRLRKSEFLAQRRRDD